MEDRRRLPLVRLELSRARLLHKILRRLPDFPSAQELPEKEVIQLVFLARRLFASQTSLLELDIPRPRTRNWNANAVVPPSNDSDPVLHILGDVHGQFQDLLRIFEAVGFQLGSQVESVEREVGQLERECADLSAASGGLPAAALGRPLLRLLKANPVAPPPPVAPPNASKRGNIVVGQSKSMSSSSREHRQAHNSRNQKNHVERDQHHPHRHQHGVSSPPASKVFAAGGSNVKSVLLDSPPMHGLVPGSPGLGVQYRERSGGATKVFDTPMSPLRLPFSSGGLLGGAFGGGGEGSKPLSARRPSRENTAHGHDVARNKSPQNYDEVEGSVLHAAAARRSPRSNAASPPPHQNQFRLGSENLASLAPVATDDEADSGNRSCKKSRYELELAQSPDRSSDREKRRLQRHVSSPSVDSILWKRTGHADAEEIRQRESFAQAVDGSRWWQNGWSPEPASGMAEQGNELARRKRASSLPSLAGSCVSARSGRVFLPSSGLRQESGAGASFGERFARSREAIQRKRSMQQAGIRSDHMVVVDEDCMDGESGFFPAAKRPRVAGAAVGQHGHFGEQGGGVWGKKAHAVLQDARRTRDTGNKNRSHRFLFLGDYVDRGMRSIDVVCLLYALALLPPQHAHTSAGGAHEQVIRQKIPTRAAFDDHSAPLSVLASSPRPRTELLPAPLVSLLRGNHECPCINRVYGFYDECKRRYSVRLWKCFVDSFNMLPVAAVVNDKIICMHGGLSPELQHLDDIRAISRPTAVPSEGLLCDLLWSDPDDEVLGWAANDRGISHVFGADVVDEILMRLNGEWVEEAGEWALQGGEEEDEQKGTTPPTAKVLEIEDVEMVPVEDDAGMQAGDAKQDGEKTHPVAGQRGDGSPHNSPPARPAGSAATETSAEPPCVPMKGPNSASPSPKAVAPNQSPTSARAAAPRAARPRSNAVLPNIELIVRAHQVVQDGYEFFANRKLVTLFSAPNYCGEFDNAAAVLSVSNTLRCRLHVVKAKNVE